jgi:hypothetical protein
MQHFPRILTHFVHQALSNSQKPGESCLDDLIEVGSVFSGFEAEDATDG